MKKFPKDVEIVLERLGLTDKVLSVNVDLIFKWLTREIVGRMLLMNTTTTDKAKLFAYYAQNLTSLLSAITRKEQLNKIFTSDEVDDETKSMIRTILGEDK